MQAKLPLPYKMDLRRTCRTTVKLSHYIGQEKIKKWNSFKGSHRAKGRGGVNKKVTQKEQQRNKTQKLCYLKKRGGKFLRINWVTIRFSCRGKYW